MDEEKEERGFTISDKRFSARKEEETSAEAEEKVDEPSPSVEEGPITDKEEETPKEEPQAQEQEFPPVNFLSFLLSLNSSALFHLGELKDPQTDEATVNLPLAHQTIDIISILEEKTKGNLTEEEEMLLKDILYDLRMRYVKKASP